MGRVISRGPQNLLAWDEELDRNPPWVPERASIPSITAPAPNGQAKASILHEDATPASSHRLGYSTAYLEYGKQYTFSIYGKPINRDWMRIIGSLGAGFILANFNFATGATGAQALLDHVTTEYKRDGWYRAWFVITSDINAIMANFLYHVAEADNDSTFNGLDQDSLYLWRPQINEGFGPDPDFLTQEVPRT